MKKLLVVSLLFFAVTASAQENLKSDFQAYTDLLVKKDFNKAMDYVHEGMFKLVPKEQLVQFLEQTFNNPQIEIDMSAAPVLSDFSEIKTIGGQYYVKFKNLTVIKMKFSMIYDSLKTTDENKTMLESVKGALNTQFGSENVAYNDATKFFTLQATKPVIASSADKKKWKFTTIDSDTQKPLLEQFLPKELLN